MSTRRLVAFALILALLVPGLVVDQTQVSANPSATCAQLSWYVGELTAAGERIDAQEASGPDMDQIENWSEADFDTVIAFYDEIVLTLTSIVPPDIATAFHATFLGGIELFQEMLETMKRSGVFAMLAYLEPIAELNRSLADLALPLETECGVALFDHDEDGEPEVGLGAAIASSDGGAPVTTNMAGSVAPIGTTVQTSEAFSLTVVSVDQNALAAVQQANPGSVPPEGFQFVNVELKLGHLRDQTDTFELETLVALGPTGVAYSAVDNSCGPINGPLSPGEYGGTLSMTGHVCFVIATQDVEGLRLYDASQSPDERVYLSLDPAKP